MSEKAEWSVWLRERAGAFNLLYIKNDLLACADRIEHLQSELTELRQQVISGFYEDEFPSYAQGVPTHELQDVMTAAEANGLIKMIKKLRQAEESLDWLLEHRNYEDLLQMKGDIPPYLKSRLERGIK